MVSAAQTRNEHEQIKTFERYGILDTPPEREFDDITHLAAQICETPLALISLVDEERKWFKTTVGLELCELPRIRKRKQFSVGAPRKK